MKRLKSKMFIFFSFLFSLFFIGSAFSVYIFENRINEHVDRSKGLMDDIDINYELDANAYTVYFFPSSKWANYIRDTKLEEGQSLENFLSVDKYKKYLKEKVFTESDRKNSTLPENNTNPTDDEIAQIFGYFPNDENLFGYKVRYADTCISTDTFDQMPVPLTIGRDSEKHLIRFSGWTANVDKAIKYGYNSQGTYDYISSYDELSNVYNTSNENNSKFYYDKLGLTKTIFVFPVLTAGKDYDENGEFNGQTVVRIHNRDARKLYNDNGTYKDMYFGRELYFSQTGKGNSAYYFYNNLRVKENEMLYLDVDIKSGGKCTAPLTLDFK